jgi:flagellar hook-associated protein 1 FlgK
LRQQKIEQLSNLVNIQTTAQTNGGVDISISGVTMVSGTQVKDTLQTYDAGGGQILLRGASSGTPLTLSSGSIQGTIDARDGAMKDLSDNLAVLASQLVTEVNNIHQTGYGLNGSTGAAFFVGTNAATIQVNAALVGDPALLQAAGVPGAAGDNKVALALAQLANKKIAGLSNQTLSDQFGTTVASLGQAISSTSSNISDQQLVSKMLQQQRDSVSGVSLDEEMTDMMKYQKAYEASAHLITTLDQMLETVLTMKQ